ncbi:AraC family transcriptional regulator [Agrobacterium sp. SHOUNA12C]|uniref:AraC family transcriptional regulator n=1 Tax=Rhizobium rhizogenes NBRC 13257 TaxID=1220581 RepID=A0AA87Q8D6_RHIRH|nr:AraC family transcriptional regulator [Rhizobium rhizogenes]KAA6491423.1 AraC family transcriptional regulator [Agrobacterium sp. ICMP 7243]MCJ9722876.1 AraC family transcriptional regulator [Agrobacterium sp. BETTINA12B]MCJ9760551.1 AraC family transcriptional regulator [Agrobacterium sp. SHOUNA12C]OCJ02931.1 AraC family transcriptional regulator [Agrobacterium sp. 13-626]NTF47779.1 AraC family transcriptional regulator [Rhizobium rhizogenes]
MSSALKDALIQFIESSDGGDNGVFWTGIDGFCVMRSSEPKMPHKMIYRPALCVIVQGAKQLMLHDRVIDYAEMQALIISIELPAAGRVIEASPEKPYIAISLEFDVGMMREVMEQLDVPPKPTGGAGLGIFVEDLSQPLADCLVRLTGLLATPRAIPVLHPAIMREICFWLLTGLNGGEVCKLVLPDSQTRRIADAIRLLRDNFAEPVRIEQLAAAARMSPSSFHQHFKTLTSMTPLQYQKQMRLLEARRLMVAGSANVENAAYRVGYESASQFSREYTRMFGAPPKRDVAEMRVAAE